MSLSISQESINKAFEESDKNVFLTVAQREKNLFSKEGMQLRIQQENILDRIVNGIDGRRIKLEKKAEILHDFYGDRLLAKDLFKDYLEQKKYKSGVAHLLSIGLLGANAYTKVMKSSVFMGKIGTLTTIACLECVGRNLSNNWLENHIDRPWKIHTYRQSNGLGATNVRSNTHDEVFNMTKSYDSKVMYDINDTLFNGKVNFAVFDPHFKIPLIADHYKFAPDENDLYLLDSYQLYTPVRIKKQIPDDLKNNVEYVGDNTDFLRHEYPVPFKQDRLNYEPFGEVVKLAMGYRTAYKPDYTRKLSAFESKRPEDEVGDKLIVKNEYQDSPEIADIESDLPPYSDSLRKILNITEERIELFKFHWVQRIKFKEVKKQIAEILRNGGDPQKVNKLLAEFNEQNKIEEQEFLESKINIIDENEHHPELLFRDEEDVKFYENYYNNVYCKRPIMTKEESEPEEIFDFPIDPENYNPWSEYKAVYSGIYKKGKLHWILKRIPEWKFLQIGEIDAVEENATNRKNRFKPNLDDSIFNILTTERYFNERLRKEGLYKGRSQAIRI